MSFDEYLAFEENSPIKHEYVSGEAYAMTGVTTRHNLITLPISVARITSFDNDRLARTVRSHDIDAGLSRPVRPERDPPPIR